MYLILSARERVALGLKAALTEKGRQVAVIDCGLGSDQFAHISEPPLASIDHLLLHTGTRAPLDEVTAVYSELFYQPAKDTRDAFFGAERRAAAAYCLSILPGVVNRSLLLEVTPWSSTNLIEQWESVQGHWPTPDWRWVEFQSIRPGFFARVDDPGPPTYISGSASAGDFHMQVEMPSIFLTCLFIGHQQWHLRSVDGHWLAFEPGSFTADAHRQLGEFLIDQGLSVGQYCYGFNGRPVFWSASSLPSPDILPDGWRREYYASLAEHLVSNRIEI